MFDIDRILAIPDQAVDYLQCGIAGKERAALEARGFVRKDGIKAKDYMIRTIQKTAKNKEKAIIKGDKKLSDKPVFRELDTAIAGKARKAIAGTAKANPLSKQIAKIGVADLIRKQEKETQPIWDKFNNGEDLSPADIAKIEKLDVKHTRERIKAKEKVKALLIKNGETQGADIIFANLGNEARQWDRLVKEAAKDEIKSRKVVKNARQIVSKSDRIELDKMPKTRADREAIVQKIQSRRDKATRLNGNPLVSSSDPRNKIGEGLGMLRSGKDMSGKKISDLEYLNQLNSTLDSLSQAENQARQYQNSKKKGDATTKAQNSASSMDKLEQLIKLGNESKSTSLNSNTAKKVKAAIASPSSNKIAVTYNKQGDLSAGSAAKKIKDAIARSKKPVGKVTAPTKEQILSSFKPNVPVAKDRLTEKDFAYSDGQSYVIKVEKGRNKTPNYEVYSQGITGATKKATIQANTDKALTQVADAVTKIYGSPDVATSATPKSRKVVKGISPRDQGVEPVASSLIKKAKNEREFLTLVDRAKTQSEKAVKGSTKNISSAVKKAIADMPKSFTSSEEKNAYREKISDLIKAEVDKGINDHFKFSPYKSKVELKDAPQDFLEKLNTKDLQRWSTRKVRQISTAGQKASQDFYKAYGSIPVEKQSIRQSKTK